MRFVERVVGERKDCVPQHFYGTGRESVGLHTVGEALVLLVENIALLLAHCLAQNVCSRQRIARHALRDSHDLFLIDNQAVGFGQDVGKWLGQFRVDRLDRLPPVLAVGVIVVRVDSHRPRSVQRQHGDDVLETSGLHAAKEIAHRGTVELKHSEGVAAGQQLVSGWIIECQCLQYYLDAPVRFDVLQRVADDREVAQAEEVHLQQPDGLT